jgi:dihydrofolate synthase/folylpolyglutamate synthase
VIGVLQGRDVDDMLDRYGVRAGDEVVATTPPSPRGLPARDLASIVAAREVDVVSVPDVGAAVDGAWQATRREGDEGLVMVTGSLYAVGAARTACRRLGLLGS